MRYFLALTIFALSAVSSGFQPCYAAEKEGEVKTVDWYMAPENEAVYRAKIAECKRNPGELMNTPDCINAMTARHRKFAQSNGPSIRR